MATKKKDLEIVAKDIENCPLCGRKPLNVSEDTQIIGEEYSCCSVKTTDNAGEHSNWNAYARERELGRNR